MLVITFNNSVRLVKGGSSMYIYRSICDAQNLRSFLQYNQVMSILSKMS